MRLLNKNKQTVWYSNYISMAPVYDDNGLFTGDYKGSYTTPNKITAYVSTGTGGISREMFVSYDNYSRLMIVEGTDCPITNNSKIWVGRGTDKPSNFIVAAIAVSLNHTNIALQSAECDE